MSEKKSGDIGCLYAALILFGVTAIKPLFGLIMGVEASEMISVNEYGDISNDVDILRGGFLILLIAVVFYVVNKIKKSN